MRFILVVLFALCSSGCASGFMLGLHLSDDPERQALAECRAKKNCIEALDKNAEK